VLASVYALAYIHTMTNATTTETMAREMFQNHERRTCPGCRERIMKSRHAYRYANGEVRCLECPAPVAAPVVAPAPAPVVASRPAPYVRQFGALALDGASFRSWEREYDEEGR
jgi:hypothetical protein